MSATINGLKVEIYDEVETADEMAELLEYIKGLIQEGYTSGFYPGWKLV